MKDCSSLAMRVRNRELSLLDQTQLPGREVWLEIATIDDLIAAVKRLSVRGAPLIGIASSAALALYSCGQLPESQGLATPAPGEARIRAVAERLRAARPTAVNLMNNLDRMLAAGETAGFASEALIAEAERLYNEDVELCEGIARHGIVAIPDGAQILTHCNTGGLGTAGIGTALGVIRRAHEAGKNVHVWVDETRPLLQGGRLTTWELEKIGVPYTLITDNMAAILMRERKVDAIIVGADRIALNGDFANKVGTYGLSCLARLHDIPFYTAAPHTTVDPACRSGESIPIEERDPDEVRGFMGDPIWAPAECKVFNPAFDVTPVAHLSGVMLDSACLDRAQIEAGAIRELMAARGFAVASS